MKNWWKKFEKFGAFPLKDKLLFLKVFFGIIFIKIALFLLPFRVFRMFFSFLSSTKEETIYSENYIQKITTFTKIISYSLPFSVVCLPQALVVKYLLRKDKNFSLKIGVNKQPEKLQAHAWVEKNGKFIIGESPLLHYLPLWEWE